MLSIEAVGAAALDGAAAFEGAYIEVENGEVRYYCRSRLDGVRTQLLIAKLDDDAASTFYDGHTDIKEMDPVDEKLMLEVLSNPTVQRVMAMFGATLVGFGKDPPEYL